MEYNALIPEIYVSDFERSLSYYHDLLGFKVQYVRTQPAFAFLALNSSQLMIQEREPTDNHTGPLEHPYGRGVNFQIAVEDIEAVNRALKAHDYPLRSPLREYWRQTLPGQLFGSRELQVLDPDGYYLRFSQALGPKKIS